MADHAAPPGQKLPPLREDLRLQRGADGRMLVYDPLAHRYHELSPDACVILALWRGPAEAETIAAEASVRLGRDVPPAEILSIARMLDASGLLAEPLRGWKSELDRRQAGRKGPLSWLLHNYLFIRVPLVRPDAFLQATLPAARRLAATPVLLAIAGLGLVGLVLAVRQWSVFESTFMHFLSVEGALFYGLALCFVKILHELGHAYAARAYGCRVPTMGVAFVVLAPLLYSDVTDGWRLENRRQRMIIGAAGVLTELAVAAIALFAWAVLPDGTLRSAAYFLATVSLIGSLAINASPLMRFDGYYLLADAWGIPNLQQRAFALMRWRLRELLFGLGDPCPEDWTARRRAAVLAYAVVAAIYRLFLFIGIALLVYHMTFKLLGILLFLVEIIWFVARPIHQELRVWWSMRGRIAGRRRSVVSLGGAAAVVALAAVPLPHRVEVPAIVEPVAAQAVFAPASGQLVRIHVRPGDSVAAGDVLFSLAAPKLEADIARVEIQLALARERHQRRAADRADRDSTLVIEGEIAKLLETLDGLRRLRDDLAIKASLDGTVREIMPDIHERRWIQRGEELAAIVGGDAIQFRGYASEEAREALRVAARGRFIPDAPRGRAVDVRLAAIAETSADALDLAPLSSLNGGPVAAVEDGERKARPVLTQFPVLLHPEQAGETAARIERGIVRLEGEPVSYAGRVLRRTAAILIREAGF
jgi:putative peptide zinc metalloprotease protein